MRDTDDISDGEVESDDEGTDSTVKSDLIPQPCGNQYSLFHDDLWPVVATATMEEIMGIASRHYEDYLQQYEQDKEAGRLVKGQISRRESTSDDATPHPEHSRGRPMRGTAVEQPRGGFKLMIKLGANDHKFTKESLETAFSPHGAVKDVYVPEGKYFAFISYDDQTTAETAGTAMNGTFLDGTRIFCEWAVPKGGGGPGGKGCFKCGQEGHMSRDCTGAVSVGGVGATSAPAAGTTFGWGESAASPVVDGGGTAGSAETPVATVACGWGSTEDAKAPDSLGAGASTWGSGSASADSGASGSLPPTRGGFSGRGRGRPMRGTPVAQPRGGFKLMIKLGDNHKFTKESLEAVFSPHGPITDTYVPEGKHFAFISYDDQTVAETAGNAMNGTTVDGTRIVCDWAQPKGGGGGGAPGGKGCFKCGQEGHMSRDCTGSAATTDSTTSPWGAASTPAPAAGASSAWGDSIVAAVSSGWGSEIPAEAPAPVAAAAWGSSTESSAAAPAASGGDTKSADSWGGGGSTSTWGSDSTPADSSGSGSGPSTGGGFSGRGQGRPMRGTPVAQPRGGYKLMIKLGNDHKFTKDSLEAAFSPHGPITDTYVPEGKHFAFISYAEQATAETAGTAMNGTTLNGTRIFCDWATPKGGGGGAPPPMTTDFSSSSGWGTPAASTTPSAGGEWGTPGTADTSAPVTTGWGSSTESSTSAPAAAGGWGSGGDTKPPDSWGGGGSTSTWGSDPLPADISGGGSAPPARGGFSGRRQGRPMRGTAVAQPRGGFKLMIKLGNDHKFTKESLEAAFSSHGPIKDTYVPEGKHFAFISYDEQTVAETAGTAMNGTTIDGTRIFCDWAQPKGGGGGGAPGGRGCFKCGQEGHMSRDCTGSAVTTDSSSNAWAAVSTAVPASGGSAWGDSAATIPPPASSSWGASPAAVSATGWHSSGETATPTVAVAGWGTSTSSAESSIPNTQSDPTPPAAVSAVIPVVAGWGQPTPQSEPAHVDVPATVTGWGGAPASGSVGFVIQETPLGILASNNKPLDTRPLSLSERLMAMAMVPGLHDTPAIEASGGGGWDSANSTSTTPASSGGWGASTTATTESTAPSASSGGWGSTGDSAVTAPVATAGGWGSDGATAQPATSWGDSGAASTWGSDSAATNSGGMSAPTRGGYAGRGGGRPMRGTAVAQPRGGYKLMIKLGDNHKYTKDSLEAVFSPHGPIKDTYVPEGKHFAFISYDDQTVAETAGNAMNGTILDGTRIFCDWAQPKGGGGGGAPGGKGCFKCGQEGHMSRDCTGTAATTDSTTSPWGAASTPAPTAGASSAWGDSTVAAVSSGPVPVVAAAWGSSAESSTAAPAAGGWGSGGDTKPADSWGGGGSSSTWGSDPTPAENGASGSGPSTSGGFSGRGQGRPMRGTPVAQPRGGYKLMIKLGNDHKFTKESLEAAFSPHGPVTDIYVPEGKHFAFISYAEQTTAETAGTAMNGTILDGTRIFCDWATPKGGAGGGGAPPPTTSDSSSSSGWGTPSASTAPSAGGEWGTPAVDTSAPVATGWGSSTESSTSAPAAAGGWDSGGDTKPADSWGVGGSTSTWGSDSTPADSSGSGSGPSTGGGFSGRGQGRPMRGTPVAQPRGGYKLMIKLGNDHKFTKDSLEAAFSPHGPITDTYVPEGKHFAFISYAEQATAETAGTAMNGTILNGTRIFSDWATPKGGAGAPPPATTDSSTSSGWGASTASTAPSAGGKWATPAADTSASVATAWGSSAESSTSAPAAAGGWGSGGDTKPADSWGGGGSTSTWGSDPVAADASGGSSAPPARGGFSGRGRGRPMRGTAVAQPRGGYKLMIKLGNDHKFTKDSLEAAFSLHGPIKDTYVPEGKHFAFISYDEQTVAETAGNAMNGTDLDGTRIYCDWAQPKGAPGGGGAPSGGRACHKCGQEGHMARDCTGAATTATTSDSSSSGWGASGGNSGWGDTAATTAPDSSSSGWGASSSGETKTESSDVKTESAGGWASTGDSKPAAAAGGWGDTKSAGGWGDTATGGSWDAQTTGDVKPPVETYTKEQYERKKREEAEEQARLAKEAEVRELEDKVAALKRENILEEQRQREIARCRDVPPPPRRKSALMAGASLPMYHDILAAASQLKVLPTSPASTVPAVLRQSASYPTSRGDLKAKMEMDAGYITPATRDPTRSIVPFTPTVDPVSEVKAHKEALKKKEATEKSKSPLSSDAIFFPATPATKGRKRKSTGDDTSPDYVPASAGKNGIDIPIVEGRTRSAAKRLMAPESAPSPVAEPASPTTNGTKTTANGATGARGRKSVTFAATATIDFVPTRNDPPRCDSPPRTRRKTHLIDSIGTCAAPQSSK